MNLPCNQAGCSELGAYRFTWPGQGEKAICERHSAKIRVIADALGMHLQLIPISPQSVDEIEQLRSEKNGAYAERNQCVALLAKLSLRLGWNAGVATHLGADWEDDWRTAVYLELPTGQVSWHFHASEQGLLEGLPQYSGAWDGHSTEEKYQRVNAVDVGGSK